MKHKQSGQVLLVTIMLLATVLTVVLSVSFKSTTDTQITKLEQDSQRALSAAEAAIEEALKTNNNTILGQDGLEAMGDFSGGATYSEARSSSFITPLLQKDEQYTFYLQEYDPETKLLEGTATSQDITVCFKSSGQTNPAVEITLINTDSVKRYTVDSASPSRIASASTTEDCSSLNPDFSYGYTIPSTDINATKTKLMIVRMFYTGGKIFFKGESGNFPLQGKTVSSTATVENTKVTKTAVLFQSYPQIPSEFFVSAF